MNHCTALLVVDVQLGMDDPSLGQRNNLDAEINMSRLLHHWRARDWPVLHVQHCSTEPNSVLRPDQPGVELKPDFTPRESEVLFQKNVNSAFIGTELEHHLRTNRLETLVVVGLTTDHCISTTVRMAANMGFKVLLVDNATATFDRTGPDGTYYDAELMHNINLASLHGEFCQVVKTESLISDS